MNINQIDYKIRQVLSNKPVHQAYLFGSILRETYKKANDIDILIELERDNDFSLIDFSRLQIDLTEALGKKVDLLTIDSLSPEFLPDILNERVLIYEK